ncbi:iron chelate uptake ABC transporter family permease subunit [Enterocloster citroniae]|jgi:iron complex transport system permease protein|uniref:Iron chelate uptake ABC transporter family permease subunit n=4 Tax=Enterocloster citroniae TaxID=358743 RepID=A0AA41K5W5_9FIRM|nr:iron chelate uptake ABC transporter family permease subunit [Enterocloster citroniae]MCC3384016.1 iron ABC transporter permease [Enterocloster citroniae]RGC10793.1 iron ABC transporter permease [Enterocloster citroniae]
MQEPGMEKIKKKHNLMSLVIFLLPIAVTIICIGIGRYHISPLESLQILVSPLTGQEVDPQGWSVVYHVRLPRIMLALVAGMGLSISGASFQALFSNPLATPDTLGVATGASFGAVLALLFTRNVFVVQLAALAMGLAALAGTCMISRLNGKSSILMVVLGGMVVSSLFQALVSLVKYVADPDEDLPAITYWLMGSMSRATYQGLAVGIPLILLGVALLFLLRWRLNILSLQEDETRALGIDVRKLRIMVMAASTLVTASCVSLCGQVGWVGLLIPHVARMLYGSDNRKIIPVSMGLGSAFMVVIDTASRAATAAEIPVSILTAIIGAPFFIILLRRTGGARL